MERRDQDEVVSAQGAHPIVKQARFNPHLDGVADTIRALETALGEEGRKDDKK